MIDHPITPPTDLLGRWEEDWHHSKVKHVDLEDHIATQAAQWGWEQRGAANEAELQKARDGELEACCEWIAGRDRIWTPCQLRTARRPKPPSLAEQATAELDDAVMRGDCITTTDAMPLLRAAIKRLAELESNNHYSPCTTDYRAMCDELEDAYTWCIEEYMTAPAEEDTLIQRARAALAQPEPVAPTDEELWALGSDDFRANYYPTDAIAYARAVLAKWGANAQ